MKTKSIVLGTGVCGVLAGFLVSANIGKNDLAKIATVATLLTVPVGIVAHSIGEGKGNSRAGELEDKLSKKELDAGCIQNELKSALEKTSKLGSELSKIQQNLKDLTLERDTYRNIADSSKPTVEALQRDLAKSLAAIADWERKCAQLQQTCNEWESSFASELETLAEQEVERRLHEIRLNEIKQVCAENDAVTDEAMALMRRMRAWSQKLVQKHDSQKEFVHQLTDAYNGNLDKVIGKIDDINQSFDKERDGYLTQIDCLNQRIALLQREVEGDLIEPEFLAAGYANEGAIANDIARLVWQQLKIPLAVKGYQVKSDGSTDVGYGYSRVIPVEALVSDLSRYSDNFAKVLRINKITNVCKHELSDLIVLTFRREAAVKADTIKLIAGTAEQFLDYVVSHPLRYRLIADPGQGKTPTTAVMVSEILKVGGTRGNTGKGKKIPNTLVTVSCPDVESSQKDADYPLEVFLKYGNTTAAVKSFSDAEEDWKYRKRDTNYAQNFFQLWIWDELDNTLNNADDPKAVGERFKNFLKQAHHTGVGWIVSGQSVMTKQIPGFMDDDRELFTQIIIGTSKIRKYLEKYGKKILSDKVVNQLLRNLEDLEPYIEDKNSMVTDAARLLRLALVLDDKSPKLYFLPNLDSAKFDSEKTEDVITQASQAKRQFIAKTSGKSGYEMVTEAQNAYTEEVGRMVADPPFPTIGGSDHSHPSDQIPHCPHCGGNELKVIENGKRYQCKGCTKRFVTSKVVWK